MTTILIAEDNFSVRSFMRMILRAEGFELAEADDGQHALDQLAKVKPDVILLDLDMPVMNGIECCRKIKSDPKTKGIPVLMVTANTKPESKTNAYSAGCDDYLYKPVKKIELLAKIRRQLNGPPPAAAAPTTASPAAGTPTMARTAVTTAGGSPPKTPRT